MEDKTVLVIEDNSANRKLVRTLLRIKGYNVLEAEEAVTGIELAREHMPDLILMDIQLPGMDGLCATRKIKEDPILGKIPVIALSAHAMKKDQEKAMKAGCDAYITKPFQNEKLMEDIGRFISGNTPMIETGDKKTTELLSKKKHSGYKNRIMIVDDEPINLKILGAKLSSENYEIIHAFSGQEALDKTEEEHPDLILLDIMMPGMDGYEVMKRLKKNPETRDIPIIIVTVLVAMEEKLKAMEAGADEFLNKPVNTIEIQTRVKSMLNLKQYRDQLILRNKCEENFTAQTEQEDSLQENKEEEALPSVLLVEDSKMDAKLILHFLKNEPYRIEYVKSGEEAISHLQQKKTDLVLLDILLPNMDGFEVCRRMKELPQFRDVQIVVVTCLQDLEHKIKGIELGADDYLIKPVESRDLKIRIKTLLKKKTYLDHLRAETVSASNASMIDEMTGLYNRSYLKHFLDLSIQKSHLCNYPVSLLTVHIKDDTISGNFTNFIKNHIRETGLVARYDKKKIAIVLPYVDREGAIDAAEKIEQAFSGYLLSENASSSGNGGVISIGTAVCPLDASTPEDLIQKSDSTLNVAK